MWRISDCYFLFSMQTPEMTPIQTVTISSDGRLAAAGTHYGVVYLWQTSNGVLLYLLRRGTGQMDMLHFLPDVKGWPSASKEKPRFGKLAQVAWIW